MVSTSTQFSTSRTMGTYDPFHYVSMQQDTLGGQVSQNTSHLLASQLEPRLTNNESLESSQDLKNDISEKLQRRLAQNREAARKSRLKKKAYVQELESGRLKLAKLEHEIERTRQQGAYVDLSNTVHGLLSGNFDSGIAIFETKYDLWVVEQHKKESQLMAILQTDVNDVELRVVVDGVVNHYHDLFQMKADAAKSDAFNLLYGTWRSPVERLFQWLGGFRPSEVLYTLMPWFEPLTDTQVVNLSKLRHTCRQAEDALTQGIDKLEQTLAQGVGINMTEGGSYGIQMKSAMEGLEALENFLNQADHLRYRTLQQMSRILTVRQAARGLVALGEYFQRLRVLNSLWSSRPHGIGS
ncbi:transcription factor TGA3 [Cynara cardunculus var. scolymus]|uniref:transcription factor TGA3 n=1 Tax=Cynara cardunculus var. scolymus TaxID=59895 RepID=UPI000D62C5E1|nr:transcription factor TGA3 [Cynara cardunculus var. scolymus]XP_024976942.1 transcription factor TGA3 [Cynara cardunculus var. scolymus]XP_024976943.1 transcription factor TGA3 [Cynara cardunculus var. scolymus]